MACRERALPQKVELVLVEAALETQEQAVVAQTRRVDHLLVDEERVDDAAHLNELLPISAVAREARDLPGGHRADLAQADLGDHALETGARGPAGGRAAEVLVDDLDLRPAELRETVAHGVLEPLALAVVLDLISRGLTDVEHRLAGPVLGADYSTSILLVQRLMDGAMPGCPRLTFGVVDVRDVAGLHICAIKSGGSLECWGNDSFGQVSGPNGSPYR